MKNSKLIYSITALLLVIVLTIPCGAVNIKAGDEVSVGGMPFGVKFYTGNMSISGFAEVDGENYNSSPAYDAGLREKDIILKVNGEAALSAEDVINAVSSSEGNAVSFECKRDDQNIKISVTPIKSLSSGTYKIGILIKDSTQGIGTVTFIDEKSGFFGGLGHGICSGENGEIIPIDKGIVSDVTITGVKKGEVGSPGELKGFFEGGKKGIVTLNCDSGVFGILTDIKNNTEYQNKIQIAHRDEIKSGKATILCTLGKNEINEYNVEISLDKTSSDAKSFNIKITDKKLIDETGGIVQGMSGSPIIQNGKLIGAVTHVLVADPTSGYGIFIDNMLDAANNIKS